MSDFTPETIAMGFILALTLFLVFATGASTP
jgi:hypothetical protein